MTGVKDCNRIHMLEWLEVKDLLPDPRGYSMMACHHAEIVYWLHARGYPMWVDTHYEIGQNNLTFVK